MSGPIFAPATRHKKRLRLALHGPTGSGKTFTALATAAALGMKVAVIDTEYGSASLYSDRFQFDTVGLSDYHPRNYADAIRGAVEGGYDVLVIDSLSHAWAGKGGVLEIVDKGADRNQFAKWRDGSKWQNYLIDTILAAQVHIIATMRSKMSYEQVEDGGRKQVKKIGMAPIQRDGMEYEFDVVGEIGLNHELSISKTRFSSLDESVWKHPEDFAKAIKKELDTGAEAENPALPESPDAERSHIPAGSKPVPASKTAPAAPQHAEGAAQDASTKAETRAGEMIFKILAAKTVAELNQLAAQIAKEFTQPEKDEIRPAFSNRLKSLTGAGGAK